MEAEEILQPLIAGLLNVPVDRVTPELSLDVPKFRSSAGKAILATAVAARLGRRIDTQGIKTYGGLLAAVKGEAPPVEAAVVAGAAGSQRTGVAGVGEVGALPTVGSISCGVDIQEIATLPEAQDFWKEPFYQEHFTPEEMAYCVSQAVPRMHLAARWCAKEALRKAAPNFAALAFAQIQVIKKPDGSVALQVKQGDRWTDVQGRVSLSHTESMAIAMVMVAEAPARGGSGAAGGIGGEGGDSRAAAARPVEPFSAKAGAPAKSFLAKVFGR